MVTQLPVSARPVWKLHPSVRAVEATGECDEAAEIGPRPRGREGAPTPGRAGCGCSFPETGVWFCRQKLADKVWIGKPDPKGLEGGLLQGTAWEEGPDRSVVGAEAPHPSWDRFSPYYKWTNQDPEMQRDVPRVLQQNQRCPIEPLTSSSHPASQEPLRPPNVTQQQAVGQEGSCLIILLSPPG